MNLKDFFLKSLLSVKIVTSQFHRNYIYPADNYIKGQIFQAKSVDFTDVDHNTPIDSYTFVFVCQGGYLEISSLLLAASLKRNLNCKHELVAAIPLPERIMGRPADKTIELLKEMGVRVVFFENEIVTDPNIVPSLSLLEKRHYITNKMYCLRIPIKTQKLIYMDTGYLCVGKFSGDARFSLPFNGLKVFYEGVRYYQGIWHKLYKECDVPMPNLRIRIDNPHVEGEDQQFTYVPPTFNSGFFSIDRQLADEFSDYWFDCWKTIDRSNLINHRRYNINQLAITVAASKLGVPFEIIEPQWLWQYFVPVKVTRSKEDIIKKVSVESLALIESLIVEYPYIAELMRQNVSYRPFLEVMRERMKLSAA